MMTVGGPLSESGEFVYQWARPGRSGRAGQVKLLAGPTVSGRRRPTGVMVGRAGQHGASESDTVQVQLEQDARPLNLKCFRAAGRPGEFEQLGDSECGRST